MTRDASRCCVGGPAAVRLFAATRPLVIAVSLIVAVVLVRILPQGITGRIFRRSL